MWIKNGIEVLKIVKRAANYLNSAESPRHPNLFPISEPFFSRKGIEVRLEKVPTTVEDTQGLLLPLLGLLALRKFSTDINVLVSF